MAGIGERTVGYIVNEVTTAIVECLWEDTVKKHMLKSEDEFRSKILDMEEEWQFPCCWSAVNGCHIPIKCHPGELESCKEYHNFKNFFSVVLMGMVDSKYRFVWASCGYPGNSHESNQEPGLSPQNWQESGFPSCTSLDTWGCSISIATVVDEAMHERQLWLSRARMVREGAFGQLKEGGGFCLEDASAARRIRRRQPLLVSFCITFALKKGIRL